jgi:hypothetical protein
MSVPEPVTDPTRDTGRRAQSIYDLEKTLVGFLENLFDVYRLDNPTLNLAQPSGEPVVQPLIVHDPDQPPVSYDYIERAHTLALKVPPRIERGRVPRTVTGEIMTDKIPDCPAILVQAIGAKIEKDFVDVTVRVSVAAYDEDPKSGGYQDGQNMVERITIAFSGFGQQGIDQAYPIILPIEWKLLDEAFPHYIAEMTTHWELPTARPMPDPEDWLAPGEHLEMRLQFNGEQQ